ncbi:chemotaxis-specific protein-glutamate methyltransferase CheB [Acidisoma sp. S159]|jgi:two-component system chemotaxis response regulator CheB|uniref:chemotaxis-specific protein-glutamate methyltransferase CheB n=1 Tax=Acidisoma sp. S159 TaxID=1747225 RepID=UPI0020B12ACE|nr:chemotaxis-specific protein-glutamate methyltransferase CheB [Acidisoma sp. S159]
MSGGAPALGKPVRVMIVEDSPVVQALLRHIIAADPRLELVATLSSAEDALAALPLVRPDVISMDIRLPGMDGLEATRLIMTRQPTPIVVIADAVADLSLMISMNALRAGALAVVEKPAGFSHHGHNTIAETIRTQLFIMSQVPVIRQRAFRPSGSTRASRLPPGAQAGLVRPRIVAIVASTGGPSALARLLSALPVDFPLPVLVVQHMGTPFLAGFAAWLDSLVPLKVRIAVDGEVAEPSMVYVAPGDSHLRLTHDARLRLTLEGPVAGQRPSGTVLFRSLAEAAGAASLGVLLTGMGEDGAEGLLAMRRAGATTLTEDESTAVVFGMPQAAVRLGASALSLPLDSIAGEMLRLTAGRDGQ